jgi:fermentation-respiration switch protein FrsA (DUF1100 family)
LILEKLISLFVYFPLRTHEAAPERYGLAYEDVWLTTEDKVTLHGWWFQADNPIASLLFCHGNAGNISHRLDNVRHLVECGFNVFIFDYRGYGLSQDAPSERGLYQDTLTAWTYFLEKTPANGSPRLIFGRSLGGAVAIRLAEQAQGPDLDGLIIESTFASLKAMAQKFYPLPGLSRLIKAYPSLNRLPRICIPLLVVHGEQDDLIPFEQGRQLFEAANPPKFFYPIPGAGHNDTWLVGGKNYFNRLVSFAQNL